MKKLILFSFFIPLFLFAQEEDKCEKEVEAKCDPNVAEYDCIMEGLQKKKNFFSKDCTQKIIKKIEEGKYPDPCMTELQGLCPKNAPSNCFALNRNRLSTKCQENLTEGGNPKIPEAKKIKKIQKACEEYMEGVCGPHRIWMEVALRDGKFDEGKKFQDQHIKCLKKAMKDPKDEECKKTLNDFAKSIKPK